MLTIEGLLFSCVNYDKENVICCDDDHDRREFDIVRFLGVMMKK